MWVGSIQWDRNKSLETVQSELEVLTSKSNEEGANIENLTKDLKKANELATRLRKLLEHQKSLLAAALAKGSKFSNTIQKINSSLNNALSNAKNAHVQAQSKAKQTQNQAKQQAKQLWLSLNLRRKVSYAAVYVTCTVTTVVVIGGEIQPKTCKNEVF